MSNALHCFRAGGGEGLSAVEDLGTVILGNKIKHEKQTQLYGLTFINMFSVRKRVSHQCFTV